jgi:hypothetical protein
MSSFWDGVFGNPAVIQNTTGELLPPPQNTPYDNLLGGYVGIDPSINNAGAQAVFPSLSPDPNSPDSLVIKAGKPAGFDLPPSALSPDVFATWHTAYQEEYINLHKAEEVGGVLTIGTGTTAIHVMLSAAQDKVYILETLQKADFATMTKSDQERIALTAVFTNTPGGLAQRLGLTGAVGDVDGPTSLYQQTIDTINNAPAYVTDDIKAIFKNELANIETRIAAMGVFSPTDINAAVQAISDRFHRVEVFAKALDPANAEQNPVNGDPNQYINVISLDNNATINRGLKTFEDTEKQILAADNATLQISNTGTLEGLTKHLDAPNLVAAFQLAANLKDQAINAGDTEEINQINELLKTYNALQELINQTIAKFDATKSDEKRGLLGSTKPTDPEVKNNSRILPGTKDKDGNVIPTHDSTDTLKGELTDPSQLKVISMFEDALNGVASPIEELLGIPRPKDFDFYDNDGHTLNYFQKTTWDQWSATLSNTVQQISQENQLKFNDINSLEKERTTHFQSATNALTKALDITTSIGRNIS